MKSIVMGFWLALLATAAVGYGSWWAYRALGTRPAQFPDNLSSRKAKAEVFSGLKPQFTLTERSGQTFSTDSLRGRVWVVSFFFTSCPGPCFRQNQALADVQKQLGDAEVTFLSITCDPATDTPEKLRDYAERLAADPKRWLFLTGSLDIIKEIGRQQFLQPLDQGSHSERAIVVDKQGKIRDIFRTLEPDEMKKMTALVLELAGEQSTAEPAEVRSPERTSDDA